MEKISTYVEANTFRKLKGWGVMCPSINHLQLSFRKKKYYFLARRDFYIIVDFTCEPVLHGWADFSDGSLIDISPQFLKIEEIRNNKRTRNFTFSYYIAGYI